MKFFHEYFNSGTIKQQNRRRLGGLMICITAVLLALALIALMIGSVATAIKNKSPKGDDGDEEGTGGSSIPNGYTTTVLDEAGYSMFDGALLQVDASHPFTGSAAKVSLPQVGRPSDGNEPIYSAHFTGNTALTQEALDAFHAMMTDFHAAVKDEEGYQIGYLYVMDPTLTGIEFSDDTKAVQQTGTTVTLFYAVAQGEKAPIYDSTAKTGVGAYKWIYDNAHTYGFVQASATAGEECVFRYVGAAHASYIKTYNKPVAEYLTLLRDRTAGKPFTTTVKTVVDGKEVNQTYNMYYIGAGETHVVPSKWTYTVSGDNVGGYFITVNRSQTVQ